jgi:hypothetical protein
VLRGRQIDGRQIENRTTYEKPMSDLIFVGIIVLFFIGSGLYVRFCEKL